MTASIPRAGFEARLASLRELKIGIDARIEELEHWIAMLDGIEAENAPLVEAPRARSRRRVSNQSA